MQQKNGFPLNADGQETFLNDNCVLTSATDVRGVIQYANPAFCEISGYDRTDLIGAPHKIIRHSDMPSGFFHYFWKRLTSGLPVCAYIKNCTATGHYYNVFAVVTKTPEGFVSVRFKPMSEHFGTISEIYQDLRKAEIGGLSSEAGAEKLEAHVQQVGYDSYESFMLSALDAEIALREHGADKVSKTLKCVNTLTDHILRAKTLVEDIFDIFSQVRGEPVNLRILAGKLEETGAAIATISKNYETMAADTSQIVTRLNDPEAGILRRMRDALDRGRQASLISAAMAFAYDHAQSDEDQHRTLLKAQCDYLDKEARTAISEIANIGQGFPDISRQLRRRINGLDLVKLLCRVESGRMGDVDNGLNGIIVRFENAHQRADASLSELASLSTQINSRCRSL